MKNKNLNFEDTKEKYIEFLKKNNFYQKKKNIFLRK